MLRGQRNGALAALGPPVPELDMQYLTALGLAGRLPVWRKLIEQATQELKAAFKAFKRRLKLERLDAESNISGGPLSSGRRSDIVAITPPREFTQAVWDELVRQGKLKKAGHGTYELKSDE